MKLCLSESLDVYCAETFKELKLSRLAVDRVFTAKVFITAQFRVNGQDYFLLLLVQNPRSVNADGLSVHIIPMGVGSGGIKRVT